AIMLPIRPHMAAIAVLSFLATLVLDGRVRGVVKYPLLTLAAGAAIWIVTTAQQTLKIDDLSSDALSDFVASKQEYGMRTLEGASIVTLPLPLKVASLLFRPMFLDARGALGI